MDRMEIGRRSTAHTATDRVNVHNHSLEEGEKQAISEVTTVFVFSLTAKVKG